MRIGYARVSTFEQSANSQALEQQIARLRPHVDEVLFDVESGKNDFRPQFKKLESLIKNGTKLTIVVTRLDRLSRKLLTIKNFINLLTSHDCEIKALDNQIDTTSAAGKFHISLLGALAEMESDQLSERIKHGLVYLRKNGKGYHPPFGYKNDNYNFVFDDRHFLSLIDSKTTFTKYEIAVQIIEKYLELKSTMKTSLWLEASFNLKMCPSFLCRWLQNPVLQGHVHFPKTKQIFYNSHLPIVDIEKIHKVLNLISFNNNSKGYSTRCAYNLSSLLYCQCGSKARILSNTIKNKKYLYIECSLRTRCPLKIKMVSYPSVEHQVFNAISNHAITLSSLLSFSPVENPRIKQLQSELAQLEAIPTPHKAIVLAIHEIKAEIESERMKTSFDSSEGDRKLFIDTFSDPDFWEFFATEPLATRQALLRKFVKKIVFNPFNVEFNF